MKRYRHIDRTNYKVFGNLRLYYRWIRTWKTVPVISWIKAARAFKDGRFVEAEKFYSDGLKSHPKHPARYSALLDLSYCQVKNKQIKRALNNLQHIVEHRPLMREAAIRLAKLQIWAGRFLESALTMRRFMKSGVHSADEVALYLLAVIENEGPKYLIKEAVEYARKFDGKETPLLEVSMARYYRFMGKNEEAKEMAMKLSSTHSAPFEALILAAEILLEENGGIFARHFLRRALAKNPEHPRALSLLAETYLADAPYRSVEYARQIALTACQNTNWESPRELHVLADAYIDLGDKMTALLIASKAKEVGSRLLGSYKDINSLDELIESLYSGTLS